MDDLPFSTNKTMFDQQPIGNGIKMNIQEYPPDFNPADLQKKNQPLPLAKRLASKVWKIRKQALEQLLKIISSENHKQFCEHESVIIKAMADSNAQCQYISAKILFNYLQKQGSYEGQVKPIIKNVIQKLMSVQRDEVFNLGIQIVFWAVDHQNQQLVVSQLNDYLINKNPKLVALSMKVIQSLVHNYGMKKILNLQQFLKHFKLLSQGVRPTAKPQAIQLFKQVYKWIGQNGFKQFSVHPQVKDQVLKWSRTYQIQAMEIKRGLKKGEQAKKVNPMQQQQDNDQTPIDVLAQYDSRWVDMILALQKWKQKKQHLEQFIKKTKVNNIVPRQTSHYITLIKRLCAQNNINLLQCGFKIVKNLCKGLKRSFSISCKSFLSYVYIKLKDNKAMIVDQTLSTLKAMTVSITIQDMYEQLRTGLTDKSPQMRLNTLKLLKQLINKKDAKTTKILKSMLQVLISLTNDSSSDVRDIALSVLCKIKQYQGMMFFEDKLQGLPAKKIDQIKKMVTISSGPNNQNMDIEMDNRGNNKKRENMMQAGIKNTNMNAKINNNKIQLNTKKPLNSSIHSINNMQSSQAYQVKNNNSNKINSNSNIINSSNYNTNKSLSINNGMNDSHRNSNQSGKMQQQTQKAQFINRNQQIQMQMIQISRQQWPINPTPAHVLRLITLFTKFGQPFTTLATPFRLNRGHFQLLQSCQSNFMIQNADLLLKWALWRVMVQDSENTQKIISVVIHLLFLLKNNLTDSQTVLVLSVLAHTIQANFNRSQLFIAANVFIIQASQMMRQKMFNFWINTLDQANGDSNYCQKVLSLLRKTYQKLNLQFLSEQFVRMARVQVISKNKQFMDFLISKSSRQFLKVSGFNIQLINNDPQQSLLKIGGPQFYINVSIQERRYFVDIFRKPSEKAMQEIKSLELRLPANQVIGLHVKILDSISIPYMNRALQSINVYNYFKYLIFVLSHYCQSRTGSIQNVTPYYRNLMRILMFFLIDLNDSKMDNKDELQRSVNKNLIILLDWMPAEHSLQVMAMLLKYSIENRLTKRLNNLLMKCIVKVTKVPSFRIKPQKNVRMLFNFFISLIQQNQFSGDQFNKQTLKSLFAELMSNYRQLCLQVSLQNLNKYGNNFKNTQIQQMLIHFVGYSNKKQQNNLNIPTQNCIQSEIAQNQNYRKEFKNPSADFAFNQNNKSMSNLPQNHLQPGRNQNSIPSKQLLGSNSFPSANTLSNRQQYIGNSAGKIKQSTNILARQFEKPFSSTSIQQIKTQNGIKPKNQTLIQPILTDNMKTERNKLQNMQMLNQSLQQLMRLKNQTLRSSNPTPQANEQDYTKQNNQKQIKQTQVAI